MCIRSNHLAMRTQFFSLLFALGILCSNAVFSTTAFEFQGKLKETESLAIYPNPINGKGTVQINLDSDSEVKVEFFDLSGKKVKQLKKQSFFQGEHELEFTTEEFNEGLYFCKVSTNTWVKAKRIIVRK